MTFERVFAIIGVLFTVGSLWFLGYLIRCAWYKARQMEMENRLQQAIDGGYPPLVRPLAGPPSKSSVM